MKEVTVHVHGGVATVETPPGVRVTILDYDVDSCDESLLKQTPDGPAMRSVFVNEGEVTPETGHVFSDFGGYSPPRCIKCGCDEDDVGMGQLCIDEEPEPEGDDLCDRCMRSGVEISHTEDGETVCVGCAAADMRERAAEGDPTAIAQEENS